MERMISPCLALGLGLFLAVGSGGCGEGTGEREGAPMEVDSLTYLALGDSYTIGESVEAGLRWPVILAGRLRDLGVPMREPVILARTGWTTDELGAAMGEAAFEPPYALVSLLIGVNNQYRGREREEYRAQFQELLTRAVALAGGEAARVVVLSIPDWGVTPFARERDPGRIAREIDAFNEVSREESLRAGVAYVDVTVVSREAASDPALLAPDGLHPSGAMYGRWVEEALPRVLEMLGSKRP